MKILVVTNIYPTSKRPFVSTFVMEQVESLRESYPELTIDVRVIEGESPRWGYIWELLVLPFIVKKGGYDIVHAHFGLTLVSTLFIRKPVVISFHGSDLLVSPTKYVSRALVKTASKVIVVAERLKEVLGYGEVIPCGISLDQFQLPQDYKDIRVPRVSGELKILFPSDPGRKIKGYDLFDAACSELQNRGYRVERVHLVNIDRANVQNIYWECDLMLLTSLSEGSPTVIKEAIAAKLPFVSVAVGDVEEWVELVNFGAVVTGRDPVGIADQVLDLMGKINTRGLLDNSKCLDRLDIRKTASRIRQLYEELISDSVRT